MWSAARSAKISMILCMPERVSGGDAKFQGFCDRWNKWEGQVRIERTVGDKTVEIARLANGSVFGEMSFLDKAGASASVVADGSVGVIHIKNEDIDELIEGDPAFGSRFYHSLAITLSRRLRATNRIVRGLG